MNIPTKVLRSTFITYETYFHHQQLAKRVYKTTKTGKKSSKSISGNENEKPNSSDKEIFYLLGDYKPNFKEDLIKWYINKLIV